MPKLIVLRLRCAQCRSINEIVINDDRFDRRKCQACRQVLKRESTLLVGVVTMEERRKKPRE